MCIRDRLQACSIGFCEVPTVPVSAPLLQLRPDRWQRLAADGAGVCTCCADCGAGRGQLFLQFWAVSDCVRACLCPAWG
eukprot:3892343-Alexandrium_andersonii.AAC.1